MRRRAVALAVLVSFSSLGTEAAETLLQPPPALNRQGLPGQTQRPLCPALQRRIQIAIGGSTAPWSVSVLDDRGHLLADLNGWLPRIPASNQKLISTAFALDRLGPDVPLHFSAFHPDWRMRDVPPTPPATLRAARSIAKTTGLRYVYTGNVHDEAGQSTYCHECNTRLIGRDWYELTEWNLTPQGTCRRCGTPCAGVFEPQPGTWGQRRQPVRIASRARKSVDA